MKSDHRQPPSIREVTRQLALRYNVLAGAPGLDVVCGEMRGDVRDERRWHSAPQLEVAALAARHGNLPSQRWERAAPVGVKVCGAGRSGL